jgi:hypothetical protein
MARKTLNHKALRVENDAAERVKKTAVEEVGEAKPAKVKKAPAKRKSRAKVAKEVRLKAFWVVFNQNMRKMASFDYTQRADADKKAAELSESQKTQHFVQLVKEPIEIEVATEKE